MQGFLLKGLTVDCTRLGSANTLFDQHFTAKKDLRSPLTNASNVAVPPFMGYIRNVIFCFVNDGALRGLFLDFLTNF